MTIADFSDTIASYLNRSESSVETDGSLDLILSALNDARRAAQRDYDFELNKSDDIYIDTSAAGANWMTGCTDAPGGSSIVVKRVDHVYTYSTQSVGGSPVYLRSSRIPFKHSAEFTRVVPVLTNNTQWDPQLPPEHYTSQWAYTKGSKLYMANQMTVETYKLDGIIWLDDLSSGSDPDIFLTYFTDWLRHATLANLEDWLKDPDQLRISIAQRDRAWESVKQMDGNMANMGEWTNLD